MDKTGQSAVVGLIAVVLIGILVVGFLSLSRVDQFAKNEAVNGCVTAASQVEENNFRGDVYKLCVEDKGYTSVVQ